jgi:AcrR family transcriptional regulator
MNKRSGSDSKQKILDGALKVFSEHGYRGASMRGIAEKAGISVGGLYLYFKGKDVLYRTLMERTIQGLSVQVESAVRGIEDPVDAITALIRTRIEYATKHRDLILVTTKEQGFSYGLDLKARFFSQQRALIETILTRGMEKGVFERGDVEETARIIMSTLRGYVFSLVIDPENLFSPQECSRVLLGGLLRRGPSDGKKDEPENLVRG